MAIICNQLLPFLATLRSIKLAIFGTFGSKMLPKMAKMWLKFLYRDRVTILLPTLARICELLLLLPIIAIFGNNMFLPKMAMTCSCHFWQLIIARNSKKWQVIKNNFLGINVHDIDHKHILSYKLKYTSHIIIHSYFSRKHN